MTGAEVAFTIGAGALSVVLAVAGYFMDKWIKSVDDKLQKNTTGLLALKYEIKDTKVKVDYDLMAKTVARKIKSDNLLNVHDVLTIKEDIRDVRETLYQRVLPHMKQSETYYGKIIIVEDHLKSQEKKLKGLYDAMLKLVGPK